MKIKAIQQSIKNALEQLKDSSLEWDVLEDTHIHLRQLYTLELKALEELPVEPYKQSMQELYTLLTEAHDIGLGNVYSDIEEFAKTANLPKLIDYYAIQKEWETFLGIGCKNKDILDKIANMERELAELKGML